MTPIQKTARVGGKEILLETGKVAKQAHGAVWVRLGDSIVLVTAVSAADTTVTSTIESPRRTHTAPWACFATLPVSRRISLPPTRAVFWLSLIHI